MGTRKSSRLAQKTFLFRWPKLLFYGSPAVAPRGVWVMLCATCCMVLCVCEWICGTAGHCTCVRDACVTVCLWVCGSFIAQSAGALFCEFSTEFRPFPTGFPSRIFAFADSFDLVSTRDCDCMRNWWPANSWHLFICPASRPKTNNKYLAVGMAMQVLFFPYFVPRPHGFIHNNFHAAAVAFLCTTFKFIMSTFTHTHTAIHAQTHTHSHWGKAANADSVKAFSWQVWGPRSPRHEIPGFLCAAGGSRFLLSRAAMTLHLHPGRGNLLLLLSSVLRLMSNFFCHPFFHLAIATIALPLPLVLAWISPVFRAVRPLLCNFFGATKWKLLVYNGSYHLKAKVAEFCNIPKIFPLLLLNFFHSLYYIFCTFTLGIFESSLLFLTFIPTKWLNVLSVG